MPYAPKFSTAAPVMDSSGNVFEPIGDTVWNAKLSTPSQADGRATLDVYTHRDVRVCREATVRLHGASTPFSLHFNLTPEAAEKLAANLLAGAARARAVPALDKARGG